jgi:radical SAM-linked protein
MVDFVQTFKKTGFTFAPEAGSQRLRNVINKNIRENDLLNTLRLVLQSGWKIVKFYFMIGLPTEKEADLEAIVELIQKCKNITRDFKDVRVNISISPFSPKPHTPFQWEKQDMPPEIERKSRYLVSRLENERITVSWREGFASCLETVFTRGGRELAGVLEQAWRNGARFDGWHEGFRWANWESAFQKQGIDWKGYLKPLSVSQPLPWDHIDMGISKSFLQKEKMKAYEGRPSADCRDSVCLGCGLQRKEFEQLVSCFNEKETMPPLTSTTIGGDEHPTSQPAAASYGRYTKKRLISQQLAKKKIRVRYTKTGLTRFISHLDVVRLFDRAARRAKISLVYSQGFHPRPKLSFGPPLSLGVGSIAEYLDLEVEMGREADFQFKLNPALPAGMQILMQKTIFAKVPSLASTIGQLTYETELVDFKLPQDWLDSLLAQTSIPVERQLKEGTKLVDIRPFIKKLEITDHKLITTLIAIEGRMAKVTEVLESLLGKQGVDHRNFYTQRTGQYIVTGDKVQEPFEVI